MLPYRLIFRGSRIERLSTWEAIETLSRSETKPLERIRPSREYCVMKSFVAILLCLPVGVAVAQTPAEPIRSQVISTDVPAIVCADQADNRVCLVDPFAADGESALLWSYPAADDPPMQYVPTDAKRVVMDDTVMILIAYHGRVRLIRFPDAKVIKDYPSYSSCHSAELLPDGLIVSVNSNHGMLRLHRSADDFVDHELPYAHGITWDKHRDCLWALGDRLYRYHYRSGNLSLDRAFDLPLSPTGHDLFPCRSEAKLLVSNNDALFAFDLESERFDLLSDLDSIKSASQHSDGTIWISDPERTEIGASFQSDSIRMVNPKGTPTSFRVDGARFYKARWWQDVDFSY
ncbi:hypothetical protein Mal65_18180 [Crateriforma conspicua]|nr:hypothetical protein Mal65_18180 [Crateriforma conspicua]